MRPVSRLLWAILLLYTLAAVSEFRKLQKLVIYNATWYPGVVLNVVAATTTSTVVPQSQTVREQMTTYDNKGTMTTPVSPHSVTKTRVNNTYQDSGENWKLVPFDIKRRNIKILTDALVGL